MMSIIFATVTIFLYPASNAGTTLCADQQEARARSGTTTITVTACRNSSTAHDVQIRLWAETGARLVVFETDNESYVPTVETDLDINEDDIDDVAVSTGKGRAADGMRYFVADDKAGWVDLGEFPRLTKSVDGKYFYAIVPGSGEVQATRVDYRYEDGALKKIRSISFQPLEGGEYLLQLVDNHCNSYGSNSPEKNKTVAANEAFSCMEGGDCPF